jgi:hypothetical protein
MRLAKNHNGLIIKCQDIENGIVKSNEYYCNRCDNILFYVSGNESNCSYFRHKKDNSCIYYHNQKYEDNFEENIMSKFHRNWQEIFPNENIEYKIEKNNKKHYADIYIKQYKPFNICDIFQENKNKLVIEIQYSSISYYTLNERDKHYKNDETNLLWIFDIKDKCEIEKIILFCESKYIIRLKGRHYFTQLFKITEKPNILLDNGGLYLYLIINTPEYDIDLLQVKKINRIIFLQQISNILGKEIKYICDTSNTKVKLYDYENIIMNISNINDKHKDQLRYIFYVLETIPYNYLNNIFEEYDDNILSEKKWYCENCSFYNYWNNNRCYKCKYSKPFNMKELITIMSNLSNKNKCVLDLFIRFINKNIVNINTKIDFGKYKGYKIKDISNNYLIWLSKNKNNKYCKCSIHSNDICKNCNLYNDINYVLRYSNIEIINVFNYYNEYTDVRNFDYTFTDFVYNYNKNNSKNLLLLLTNKLGNEDLKITTNTDKYEFIDDE